MAESEWISIRMFLVKVTLKIGQDKYLLPILFLKLILGLMKLKIYTKKKKKYEVSMKKNCCWIYYKSVTIHNQIAILEMNSK